LSAQKFFSTLRAARAEDSYDRVMTKYQKPDLLVIDDMGLRDLRHDEPLDLYELIRGRYERGSLLMTSNREAKEWDTLFADARMASAVMDRLLHDAIVLNFEGESYRNPIKRKRKD
jgi:DNA replication protein DnaC